MERRIGRKKVKNSQVEIRKDNTRREKVTTIILIKEYMKRVMHNAIAYHLEPNAQTAPELQSLFTLASSPVYILSMTLYGIEYSLG